MKKHFLKAIALVIVLSLCFSLFPASAFAVTPTETPEEEPAGKTLKDFIAGNATAEDLYAPLDASMVPAIIGYDQAIAKCHVQRLYEEEGTDLNKIMFLNVDGSKTMYTFDFPVKYVDEDGNIQDITLEIADSETQSGGFETAANAAVSTFSAQFSDGISLSGNDTSIRMVPVQPGSNAGTALITNNCNVSSDLTAQRVDSNTVVYDYDDHTTVEYSLTYTGFKEDIVVSQYTGQTTFSFRLYTRGLALEEIGGSYFLVDDDGNIQATIGDIIIFTADERNNAFGEIVPMTIVEKEQYLLNIVVDADYLADPNTAYPIRIDPTVEINYDASGSSAIEDITISSSTTYSGTSGSLYVGRRSDSEIARILMRFPGLDLTGLEGATVTSANVMLRDLMCESASMDIYCYIFGGSVWDASSATWSNCSPNNYTDLLCTKTLAYETGYDLDPRHYYAFDISKAVQGWIDGNYVQDKGIMFKASVTVESGTATTNRTFGSYNRSANKPSLSVTYEEPGTQYVPADTYYINNRSYGKFLQKNSSGTATATSGTISSLGNVIQWEVQKVTGGYIIRSANDTTKYLGVASSENNSAVTIVTVNNTSIPGNCIWAITPATNGGCLIKSNHNSCYLYLMSNSLYTISSTSTVGSSLYLACTWRMASKSDYNSRELTNSFSISKMILNVGESGTPTINRTPSDALWANPEDFTIVYSSGTEDCISVTESTGTIKADDIGIVYCKATHKVTNRVCTFRVYVDRYTYELTNEFGFDDDDAVLIRNHYEKVNAIYTDEIGCSEYDRAWYAARSLSLFPYSGVKWDLGAGSLGSFDSASVYFRYTFGYTDAEYEQLSSIIAEQNKYAQRDSVSDFAHFNYALAARLAYYIGKDVYFVLGDIQIVGENASYCGGWLGDAIIREDDSTTSFKNDDYHADLDAENIYRLILTGKTLTEAVNQYYPSLTSSNTRADIFLSHIPYATVEQKVFTYAPFQGDSYDSLEDVKTKNPDTYNFLKSLYNGKADIQDYT